MKLGGVVRSWILVGPVAAASLCFRAPATAAEEVFSQVPVKAPVATGTAMDWAGWYAGMHFGYGSGISPWDATEPGASIATLKGSLDFFNVYNGFDGTGSYFLGLQAGVNYRLGSRVILGGELDVSFPNALGGTQTFTSTTTAQASYQDFVAYTGTVRGRLGYILDNHWLIFGTGGFALAYDKLRRTGFTEMFASATGSAGDVQTALLWRLGWTVGAGIEVPVAPNWTAKLEYLYASFDNNRAVFFNPAQRFESNAAIQSLRLGFNYQIGDAAKWGQFLGNGPSPILEDRFNLHGQLTYVSQYSPRFRSPYVGPQSLIPNQGRETAGATFYLGARLWNGAELWVNPDLDQGFGLGNTHGIAGFVNGQALKVGSDYPYPRLSRSFLRQTINLGGEMEKVEAGLNQFAGSRSANRIVITAGKFSVSDIFDENRYAHDPLNDFLNWGLIDAASFDYAGDAWGYTYGASVEWYQGAWALRAGIFDLPVQPNSTELDPGFQQFQTMFEVERRHEIAGQPGKVAVTGWLSRARLGNYNNAVALAQFSGQPADIAAVRHYTSRSGIAANLEQQVTSNWGIFLRTGLASPNVEPDFLTDVDRTVAVGASFSGKQWGRPDDAWGVAGILNNISTSHQTFFNNGGLGIVIGDGQLPHSGTEQIIETYYTVPLYGWKVTFDYQFINNPAYNRDRGPVSVLGTRLHLQF